MRLFTWHVTARPTSGLAGVPKKWWNTTVKESSRITNQQSGHLKNVRSLFSQGNIYMYKYLNINFIDFHCHVSLSKFNIKGASFAGWERKKGLLCSLWRTKQKKFSLLGIDVYSHVKTILIVLSSRLVAFPRTCKGINIIRLHNPSKVAKNKPFKWEHIPNPAKTDIVWVDRGSYSWTVTELKS